jgi:hypothetical protein
MHGPMGESSYTQEVTNLIKLIHSRSILNDSLYELASLYFEQMQADSDKLKKLTSRLAQAQSALKQANFITDKRKLIVTADLAQSLLYQEQQKQKLARKQRQTHLFKVSASLVALCEGNDQNETQNNSAKVLGTLLLLSPHEGSKLATLHQKLKPAYKAVLALRLLDKLLLKNEITNTYIKQKQEISERYDNLGKDLSPFQTDVCIPIVVAALIQDIGLQHPAAQLILKGPEGDLDEFRVLDNDDRLALLKINYQQTLNYLTHGIGLTSYTGNSREEKTRFDENERQRFQFIKTLLNDSVKPKLPEGHLLKIPQIYASVVFSTKPDSNLSNLPKATLVLEKAAQMKAVESKYTDYFISIVGHFPQGYGITYIPKDKDNQDLERYEYAIVYALNPLDPFVPICRTATRHLTFNSLGKRISVPISNNLYFATTRKKFASISPERLEEILKKLCSNFEERKNLELIPSHWNPYTYFGYKKFQNLWKKTN